MKEYEVWSQKEYTEDKFVATFSKREDAEYYVGRLITKKRIDPFEVLTIRVVNLEGRFA